ncbi:unannotated protein [freshwater metagenome]|uniref:Single-stranded-DNA-specific exonuclease RecJ n=1 Tax=freshwater metagenome TaxID=449393 RepID=A0A6J7HUK3_9ZZZZ
MRFDISAAPFADVARLTQELGVSHVTAQVLARRGLGDPDAARAFLAGDAVHELADFGGLREAAALIVEHLGRGTTIVVHGDYDCDGVTSTAILVRVLRDLGGEPGWFLPSRREDGYGLAMHTVERLAQEGTGLLITVDCGITAVDEVARAQELGMEVIVTDHHQPRADGVLPGAPIVHPIVGSYPCVDLCAAGVAYRLAGALYAASGRDAALADADLELVALATVADCVPLVGENRRLVREGLHDLAMTQRPGLRALLRAGNADPGLLDEQTIGFRLAPRINAAGRMGRADAGVELLLTDDADRAQTIASELDAANAERRHVEQRITFAAEAQLAEFGEAPAYVLAGDDWHPGVIGIVASRLAERHHRPVVLIAFSGDQGTGSGRSIESFDLLAGLEAASAHLLRHGGHRAAAGCTIHRDGLGAFRDAFVAHAAQVLRPEDLVPSQRIDAVISGEEAHLGLAEELAMLAPFGTANERPTLLIPAARLADPRKMGEGRHVRFNVVSGAGRAAAVAFGRSALPDGADVGVDAAFSLEINRWNGAEEARLVLRGCGAPGAAPITLAGAPEDVLDGVWAEFSASEQPPPIASAGAPPASEDRRGSSLIGTIGALVASGDPVLVVAACAERRLRGLRGLIGGFTLCSWDALERDSSIAEGRVHFVALDPPLCEGHEAALRALGDGQVIHRAWGDPELRFSLYVLEHDHDLRPGLTALYRLLRDRPDAPLDELLRGPDDARWTAVYAGRLVRVLHELALVSVDLQDRTIVLAPEGERRDLADAPTYARLQARLEDGRRWLIRETRQAA